jgi:hypothetical protein
MAGLIMRVHWIALSFCILNGCALNTELLNTAPLEPQAINFARLKPGPNFVTFTSFADGKLTLENGCFRLKKKGASMAIIWPETVMLTRNGPSIRLNDPATRWSAKIGDRIRLGGKPSEDISAVNVDNKTVLGCASPYFVSTNIIRR